MEAAALMEDADYDESGKHKVVIEDRLISGVDCYIEKPMTLGANGKWRQSKGDKKVYAANLREATRTARGLPTPSEILTFRLQVLDMSQRQASLLLGAGPKAFQKYEAGCELPSMPTFNLMRAVERDPSLIKQLMGWQGLAHVH